MKHALRLLGWLLMALLAAYFLWFATRSFDLDSLTRVLTIPVAGAVLLAAMLYATIIPVSAWAWSILLARQGEHWSVLELAGMLGRVQLAKYLPGNIAQHAGRAIVAMRAGMGGRPFTVTVVQETLLAATASVLVGATAIGLSQAGTERLPEESLVWLQAAGVVMVVLVLALAAIRLDPGGLRHSPSRWMRLLGFLGGIPGPRAVLPAMAAYSLNYLMIGLGLWVVARVSGFSDAIDLAAATAVFALSWLLGFMAPGAPAGLGVREGIMVLLLSPVVPHSEALAFVLLARLVTLTGDAMIYGCALVLSGETKNV